MTNEELLADLKQFIEATVSQQMSQFATKEDLAELATKDDLEGIKQQITDVEQRLGRRIDTLDEKLDEVQDAVADTVQDHEQRLRRLEKRTA